MAAEFVAAATAGTIGNLATEYASPYLSYFFHFGKIVEDFKNRRNELELKRHRVKNDVDEAIRQTEVIEKDVEDWLTRTEKALGEAQNLEAELERNKCFSWCPSWGWRYRLSKRVAKKTLCISQLSKTCNFQRVGHRAILPGLEFIPSKDFMSSESSNSALKEIMDALKKGDVNMIGLYGMGGVGKTTLAKEVGKQAKQLFDKVVIVTVSQAPNVHNIQDKIADFLDLVFEKKTIEGKAEQLWLRIKDVKKILIILDDVWEELDLKAIGIPFGDDHNGCKIFLTTRLQQVCTRMNCQKDVQLNVLFEHEAWALFKDNAGLKDVSSPLNDVAKKVAEECKGLPLAIVTVGRALKDETLEGWKVVYQRLKDSRHIENQDVCGGIYSSLKISYDYLKTDSSRSCLLLCSLFPEDHEIRIEELIVYGIGQGIFDGVNLIEDARREMHVTITNLQKSGLLLKANDERLVKMHDVVRDFVHWMTSEGENAFMVTSGLKEWPKSRCYTAISLSKINIFPDKLEFPNLKTLLLDCDYDNDNEGLTRVPSMFFKELKVLNVLVLRRVFLSLEELQFLTNLRTLHLEGCHLENASALGNLKELEILVIRYSDINKLPELWELTTLRLLVIWNYSPVLIPRNLQPRLERLEELHLYPYIQRRVISLLKLCSSPHLTSLTLTVSSRRIPKSFAFPRLQSFIIIVNLVAEDVYNVYETNSVGYLTSRRILAISGFSLNAFKKLFWNVEELTLDNVMDYKNIVPSADQGGLNELTSFNIRDCKDLEYLIDTTQEQGPHSAAAFCNLVILTLTNMICLKELCHGRFPNGFLQKLEILTILECNNLIVAIPDLPNIKEVSVEDCAGLEVVFQINGLLHANEENQTSMLSSLTNLELDSLPELKHIWKGPPHLVKLQSLEVIRIASCDKLASLFPATIAQSLVHLEELHIHDCSELEHIITEAETDNNEIVSNTHLHPLCWPKLRTLDISNCPRLRYVFPTFVSECLPRLEVLCLKDLAQLKQVFSPAKERDGNNILLKLLALQELSVENCPQLTCFIVQDQIKELSLSKLGNSSQLCISTNCSQDYLAVGNHEEVFQVQGEYSFSSLNVLHLEDLCEVRLIWKDVPQVVTLENLTTLNVIDCKRLSYIFSPTTARGLSQLVCLNIQQCDKLDRIIAEDQVCSSSNADLQPMSFPNLTTISVGFCKKLKSLFPLGSVRCLPKLEKLIVERNYELEQVFELEDEAEVIIKKEIKFDQLEELSLQEQPSLFDFCPSGYHFVLPDLKCLMVTKCPKMTTCFFIDSEYSVHAKAEGPLCHLHQHF
ncbi:PREDICTED: probable disease resistance protein At4g27220 isoform X2 [Theobroma cacao]|uniref:Probable disease resistance protein At4g27220 isoform X2 n=1 Tax=Theobroma cacao TaxID=3641 RepID=A0AB32X3U8_THECC|nr:PREDICTED: probable disease resistance protein At4g27220 isoform X2 [Theobroma cacao]